MTDKGDNMVAFMASIDDRERTFSDQKNIARRHASLTAYLQRLIDQRDESEMLEWVERDIKSKEGDIIKKVILSEQCKDPESIMDLVMDKKSIIYYRMDEEDP